jgi:membrane fusion protein (multidrug efflux system)
MTTKKEPVSNSRKLITRAIFIVLIIIGSAWGVKKYLDTLKYETTDDAQVESDISPISSRISGFVSEIRFEDNQKVNKGDTLILFDSRELQIKVAQAESALQNAISSMEVTKANVLTSGQGTSSFKSRIEELKIRLATAEKDLKRYKHLMSADATTQQQYDKVQTEKDVLEKQIEMTEGQLKEAQEKTFAASDQVKVAESIINQRKNDLEYSKLQLSYNTIIAPSTGIISKKNIQTGQYIQASQPLCAIVSGDNIWIVANFKETQLSGLKENQEVEIEVDAFKGEIIKGHISSFTSAMGSKFSLIPPDNASGNYVKVVQRIPVKIEVDKNSQLFNKLKPGMSVFVRVVLNS